MFAYLAVSSPHAAFASAGTNAYIGSLGNGIPMRSSLFSELFVPDGRPQALPSVLRIR